MESVLETIEKRNNDFEKFYMEQMKIHNDNYNINTLNTHEKLLESFEHFHRLLKIAETVQKINLEEIKAFHED